MEHILLKRATRRPLQINPSMPPNARYDILLGQWVVDGTPIVSMENGPNPPPTKKCDQETGEDQKGE